MTKTVHSHHAPAKAPDTMLTTNGDNAVEGSCKTSTGRGSITSLLPGVLDYTYQACNQMVDVSCAHAHTYVHTHTHIHTHTQSVAEQFKLASFFTAPTF